MPEDEKGEYLGQIKIKVYEKGLEVFVQRTQSEAWKEETNVKDTEEIIKEKREKWKK